MKKHHHFLPLCLQVLSVAGLTGLMCAGAFYHQSSSPATPKQTEESKPTSESEQPSEPESTSESEQSSETAASVTVKKKAARNPELFFEEDPLKKFLSEKAETETETEASSETEVETETETEASSETEVETETETEASSETEVETETETEASSETEVETEASISYATPFAVPENTLAKFQTDFMDQFLLQPNYLSELEEPSLSWDSLERELTSRLNDYSGDWSVYVKKLETGEIININEHPMESASLIKLYIMGAVVEQIYDGPLEKSDHIDSLLNEMITVSDNSAANELVRCLSDDRNHKEGLKVVNDFIKRHGYNDTQHVNGLSDTSLWYDSTENNMTSARDCGELLSSIYKSELISHLACRKMENLLLGQKVTYKIPKALPSGAISASKTGEIDLVENDAAIVYSPGGDFVLCIMSNHWDSKNTALDHIHDITRLVYNHFNPPENDDSSMEE